MTRFAMLSIALFAAAPGLAAGKPPSQSQAPASAQQPADAPSPKLKNLLQSCDAHKFETTVQSEVDGKPHSSKVKLCGNEGQTDAEWIKSLQDAVDKLKTNDQMPASTRDQIIDAITAEIARLKGTLKIDSGSAPAPGRSANSAPKPLSDDYSLLPPLPAPTSPPAPQVAPPAAAAAGGGAMVNASPDESTARPQTTRPAPAATSVAIANPRLSFSCISGDYPGGGPCISLSRDTTITVKAPQPVAVPLSLRFLRQGEERAEVALGSFRKGQSVRLEVPQEVCRGVVSSEVQIQVIGGGQVLDRQGPYLLRC
jgi:hypothetical protein